MDQYKAILETLKDYHDDILKQRMRNAEKEREVEKLRVSDWDFYFTSEILQKYCLIPSSFTYLAAIQTAGKGDRVFIFSRRPALVTGYFKHLRRVLVVFQSLLIRNSVSPMESRFDIFDEISKR